MARARGQTVGEGRYTLEQHLGSGGMASVWLATDQRLGRQVAIKAMSDILADDERWLTRFGREARAAARLSHPNIVKVFDYGVEDGQPYLVMAYVAGGSLKDRLADGVAVPHPEQLARELVSALAHVHAAGILHRDVKPANILIDGEGRSHLTDFGIARPPDATAMTQTGMVMGTARYLAPEVADGAPASERSDLYAAGRVVREVAEAHGGAGRALEGLIARLAAEDPKQRPASARNALAALDGVPSGDDDDDDATRVLEPTTARLPPTARGRRSPEAQGGAGSGAGARRGAGTGAAGERGGAWSGGAGARGGARSGAAEARRGAPGRDGTAVPAAAVGRTRRAEPVRRAEPRPATRPSRGVLTALGLAAVALLTVLVIVLASSGGNDSGARSGSGAKPAAPGAPLDGQLRALDRIIDGAKAR